MLFCALLFCAFLFCAFLRGAQYRWRSARFCWQLRVEILRVDTRDCTFEIQALGGEEGAVV